MAPPTAPTLAQQRALAYASLPSAIVSSIACAYVIHHLIRREPEKLKRLYHRLILSMNFALLLLSLTWIWAPFAIPEEYSGMFLAANGTVGTCTASAFLEVVFTLAVPVYYTSLILQAFMKMKNNFKVEGILYIEKWVHIVAYSVPISVASVCAATGNFSPNGSGCWIGPNPPGCESNPNVTCTSKDIRLLRLLTQAILLFLYLVFPPFIIALMKCWVRKHISRLNESTSTGWQRVKESAKKEMMRNVAKQIYLYLFAFWFTWVFSLISVMYKMVNGHILYNLHIFANVVYPLQGCVFAVVYFSIERMSRLKTSDIFVPKTANSTNQLTVQCIRNSAQRSSTDLEDELGGDEEKSNEKDDRKRYTFNIFDGTVDESSPWAKFLNEEYDDDDE